MTKLRYKFTREGKEGKEGAGGEICCKHKSKSNAKHCAEKMQDLAKTHTHTHTYIYTYVKS